MKLQKITALLLLAGMLLSLAACSKTTDDTPADTTGEVQTTAEETTPAEETGEFDYRAEVKDSLGDYDFGGTDFHICYTSEQMQEPYFASEMDGTTVNDAVYDRTITIEDRFNVKITNTDTGGNWNEVAEAVRVSTSAGASAYDLALAHTFIGLTGLMTSGYLYNWYDVPAVDLKADWWNQNIAQTLTIGDKLYVEANDYIYQRPMVIYFNKEMIEDFTLDNPYDLVYDGTWTWDKLREMSEAVATDLNGDGVRDENDRYGFGMTLGWQAISVLHSQGMRITSINDDGTYSFRSYEDEKMFNIFNNFYDLLYNSGNMFYNIIWTVDQGAVNGYTPLFENNQLLFNYSNTELLPRFREIELSFGILPLPKYDEKQDGYYSMADTQMLIVPADAKDIEMTGVISEALAVESYKKVVPAVYETMFANKYLRDEESYDMFMITRKGLVYEAIWTYGEGSDLVYALPNLMNSKSADLASYYNARKNSNEKTLNRVVEKVLAQ